jgi:hypothetical protein
MIGMGKHRGRAEKSVSGRKVWEGAADEVLVAGQDAVSPNFSKFWRKSCVSGVRIACFSRGATLVSAPFTYVCVRARTRVQL